MCQVKWFNPATLVDWQVLLEKAWIECVGIVDEILEMFSSRQWKLCSQSNIMRLYFQGQPLVTLACYGQGLATAGCGLCLWGSSGCQKHTISIKSNTTYFLWSLSVCFYWPLSVLPSFFSLPLSITLGLSRISSLSSQNTSTSKRNISWYSHLSCAERTVLIVSDWGSPSNNAKEADKPSVERVK